MDCRESENPELYKNAIFLTIYLKMSFICHFSGPVTGRITAFPAVSWTIALMITPGLEPETDLRHGTKSTDPALIHIG